jgi:hypothetical protein
MLAEASARDVQLAREAFYNAILAYCKALNHVLETRDVEGVTDICAHLPSLALRGPSPRPGLKGRRPHPAIDSHRLFANRWTNASELRSAIQRDRDSKFRLSSSRFLDLTTDADDLNAG